MKLTPDIARALHVFAESLENETIKWVLLTSCSLALQGVNIIPKDIDILTDNRGILQIGHILNEYLIEALTNKPSDIFDSMMTKFMISNCCIEVMSDFKVKSSIDNQWYLMDSLLESPAILEIQKIKYPVVPLVKSIELYTLMGRDKDKLKILEIQQFINTGLPQISERSDLI